MVGREGPYTSASSRPTRAPSAARASARFTAVVDLPTPPLPEATARMFFTPGSGVSSFCTWCAATREATSTLAAAMAGSASSAALAAAAKAARAPAAG